MDRERIKTDIKLGKRIYDSVPRQFRPGCGTSLLMTFDPMIKNVPIEIAGLYDIAHDEKRWKDSHDQFGRIRQFYLNHRTFRPETYLLLAEKVAKITYNLSGQSAPFDSNSGDYIPSLAIETADYFNNKKITAEIERILTLHY
jgi:hypothetical protein